MLYGCSHGIFDKKLNKFFSIKYLAGSFIFLSALLSACASFYKNKHYVSQCKAQNWEEYYFNTAVKNGLALNTYPSYEEICRANGVEADVSKKETALKKVEFEYCSSKGAYKLGRSGKEEPQICQKYSNYGEFQRNWKSGRKDYLTIAISYLNEDGVYENTLNKNYGGKIREIAPLDLLGQPSGAMDAISLAYSKTNQELNFTPPSVQGRKHRLQLSKQFHEELLEIIKSE